jgi:hypothetical protein
MSSRSINGEFHTTVVQIDAAGNIVSGGGGSSGGAITSVDIGTTTDAAATSDAGAFSLIALVKRLLGKFPASVGVKASAAALPVVLASDDAQIGTKVTAVPALATGGTGLIGWLSAQWQALINLGNQLPATIGIKAASASLSVAPASDANLARETYSTVTPMSAAVNGAAGWVQLASQACTQFDLVNNTGTALEYKRGAAGTVFIPVPDGTSRLIQGIANANTIYLRRVDQSSTSVTVVGEAFAV